jgi:hypothetical protein
MASPLSLAPFSKLKRVFDFLMSSGIACWSDSTGSFFFESFQKLHNEALQVCGLISKPLSFVAVMIVALSPCRSDKSDGQNCRLLQICRPQAKVID